MLVPTSSSGSQPSADVTVGEIHETQSIRTHEVDHVGRVVGQEAIATLGLSHCRASRDLSVTSSHDSAMPSPSLAPRRSYSRTSPAYISLGYA